MNQFPNWTTGITQTAMPVKTSPGYTFILLLKDITKSLGLEKKISLSFLITDGSFRVCKMDNFASLYGYAFTYLPGSISG